MICLFGGISEAKKKGANASAKEPEGAIYAGVYFYCSRLFKSKNQSNELYQENKRKVYRLSVYEVEN